MPVSSRSLTAPAPDDVVGRYFAALTRRGTPCRVTFGLLDPRGTPHWVQYDHALLDGMGILASQLEAEGSPVPPLPENSELPPSPQRRLTGLLRCLRQPTEQVLLAPWSPEAPAGDLLSWAVLSVSDTARLEAAAQEQGGSLNSALLWALHQTAALWTGGTRSRGLWGVPVNLRGPVKLSNPRSNHVSEISVPLAANATVADVHRQVRQGLEAGRHWGPWSVLQILGLLPDAAFDLLAHLRSRPSPPTRFGGLSYLGHWHGSQGVTGRVFGPPVDASMPIGGGALVYNGALCLGLRVHGALTTKAPGPTQGLQRWLTALESLGGATIKCVHQGQFAQP